MGTTAFGHVYLPTSSLMEKVCVTVSGTFCLLDPLAQISTLVLATTSSAVKGDATQGEYSGNVAL